MSELHAHQHRKPRAVLVATLTAAFLAVQLVVFNAIAWQFQKHEIVGDGFAGTIVVRATNPFFGSIFGSGVSADTVVPWLAGLGVAVAVIWLVVLVASRKGSLAAFVGTWFAAMSGGCAGALVAAYLWARTTDLPTGRARTDILTLAFDHGLHWGFVFGWIPALVAAFLTAALSTRPRTPQPSSTTDPAAPDPVSTS